VAATIANGLVETGLVTLAVVFGGLAGAIVGMSRKGHRTTAADTLVGGNPSPDSAQAIRSAIEAVMHTQPSESDIARVRARLATGGWPLAPPRRPSDWP
jgi:Protein of unknown function (DUF3349)